MKNKFVKEYNKSRSWTSFQESFSISKIILEKNQSSKEKNSELYFFSTFKQDSHQMTHEILPHVLTGHRFYRTSSCGVYPVDVRGPTPDITTPNDLTLFLLCSFLFFKLLFKDLSSLASSWPAVQFGAFSSVVL